jgi:endonuclease/exonuclease/phosphatase family metal-dependent hydrolase
VENVDRAEVFVKVATLNVNHLTFNLGRAGTHAVKHDNIAAAVAECAADMIVLQEVRGVLHGAVTGSCMVLGVLCVC